MIAREKGGAHPAQPPSEFFSYPIAGCPTSITDQLHDGDAHKVSRCQPEFKAAVSSDPQENGDAQQKQHKRT
jgi:hypothetical protein